MRFWSAWGVIIFLLGIRFLMPGVFKGLEHTLEKLFDTADQVLETSRQDLTSGNGFIPDIYPDVLR